MLVSRLPKSKVSCVYCGAHLPIRAERQREHVVGRQFFATPRPTNLVTVTSCPECNHGFKGDEDYAHKVLCFGPAGISKVGEELWSQGLEDAFKKDTGLRAAVARGVRQIPQVSVSGVSLPERVEIKFDPDRVTRVLHKWVRGLHFFEHGQALSPAATIGIIDGIFWTEPQPDLQLSPGKRSWPGTFSYWHGRDRLDRADAIWAMRLYDTHGFVAVVFAPERVEAMRKAREERGVSNGKA